HRPIAGDHDHHRVGAMFLDRVQGVEAACTRPQIQQHGVGAGTVEQPVRLFCRFHHLRGETERLRHLAAGLADGAVMVHDQKVEEVRAFDLWRTGLAVTKDNGGRCTEHWRSPLRCKTLYKLLALARRLGVEDSTAGRNTSINVPCPGSLWTSIMPPASLTMRCTVARPRPVPVPGFLVVKNGSNSRARVSASIPQPWSCTASATARREPPASTLPRNFPPDSAPGNSAARVLNRIFPPCGMASRAFSTRFNRICRNCAGSARTSPAPESRAESSTESSAMTSSICSPISRCNRFFAEATISLIRIGRGSAACLRAIANNCCV